MNSLGLKLRFVPVLAIAALGVSAHAEVYMYSAGAIGAGTLNGVNWSGRFTISTTADTSDVTQSGSVYRIEDTPTTVTIENVGTFEFTNAINVVSNQGNPRAGFGDATLNTSLFFVVNNSFQNYDLKSAIGPIQGTAIFQGSNHATNGGAFKITQTFSGTFTSAPVPEPATLAALGIGAMAFIRRKRK